MTVSQTLSNLGDAVRNLTWKTGKMSVPDMTTALNLSGSLPNLATPFPVMNDGKGHLSTTNTDGSQTFAGQGGFTGEPVHVSGSSLTVALKKGDTLVQAFTIKSNVFRNVTFNFLGTVTFAHAVHANAFKIADDTYRVWATFTAPRDETYKLLEFWADAKATTGITLSNPYAAIVGVGGVVPTDLIAVQPKNDGFVKWQDGIGNYYHDNSGTVKNRDIARAGMQQLVPGCDYDVVFNASGFGPLAAYVWPITDTGGAATIPLQLGTWQTYHLGFRNWSTKKAPGFFIRDNSDHQEAKLLINDIRCYRINN